MGLPPLAFHTAAASLPSILIHRGSTSITARWMLFSYQLVSLTASSLLPLPTQGRHDQRWTAAEASVAVAGGFAVLVSAPALSVLTCTLLAGVHPARARWRRVPRPRADRPERTHR